MAGEAKTNAFNIGTATVMLAPLGVNPETLVPEKNSIGLVKNFTVSSTDQYTDLTQGIQNDIVWSEKTGSEISATMEVYEYTASNLAYSLGLSGNDMVEGEKFSLKSASNTEVIVAAGESLGNDFIKGDRLIIQSKNAEDLVYLGKIEEVQYTGAAEPEISLDSTVHDMIVKLNALMSGKGSFTVAGGYLKLVVGAAAVVSFSEKFQTAFGMADGTGPITSTEYITIGNKLSDESIVDNDELTVTIDDQDYTLIAKTTPQADTSAKYTITLSSAIPETMSFVEGDMVKKVTLLYVGSRESQPFLCAKVIGILPDGKTPVTIIFPKIRVTNGFNIGFQSDTYSNMPFEFTPFRMVKSDPQYDEHKNGMLYLLK